MSKNKIAIFDNSYASLPDDFYQRINPVPVKSPKLIIFNTKLGNNIGIDSNQSKGCFAQIFSGNIIPDGASPIALNYSGHQFGYFVPQLGDGRAILLGEVTTKKNNRHDIQLKGSGKTKYSRQGDGRSPVGPVIREYILSEAMHALNIPSTRSLAIVTTGEQVYRETPLPGAVLTRVAKSHIRIGTFEYFASRQQSDNLKKLADYAINRHAPEIKSSSNPYLEFLRVVAQNQAKLVAKWMSVGFIHGVMNTDNTLISGETIDYGPCAFLEHYDPSMVFSSIDNHGRYSFSNQPKIIQWNIACLAGCLLPIVEKDQAEAKKKIGKIIEDFPAVINREISKIMCLKIGLNAKQKNAEKLLNKLLKIMKNNRSDFTLTFRNLSDILIDKNHTDFYDQFNSKDEISEWLNEWLSIIETKKNSKHNTYISMQNNNPIYIPRNHLVERAIKAAIENNDYSVMKNLCSVLSQPFKEQKVDIDYKNPADPSEIVYKTFCGT